MTDWQRENRISREPIEIIARKVQAGQIDNDIYQDALADHAKPLEYLQTNDPLVPFSIWRGNLYIAGWPNKRAAEIGLQWHRKIMR